MWTLATCLHLIIGNFIPEDDKWECYLLFVQISRYCTAKVISRVSVAYLRALIDQHHQEFRKCYPDASITPKMHYMVHFPQQMLRCVYNNVCVPVMVFIPL